jgi:hypothetical protein
MADNQKLFAQMADLGRNINLLTDTVKKNTAVTEGFISKKGGDEKSGDSSEIADTLKDLNKTLKDVKKALETKPTLVNQSVESAKGENPKLVADVKSKNPGFDFSKISGGLKDVVKAFQEGGVAPKDGKYLVGENGPEVVKLPKGSGIIPVNVKDLIAGLSKIPELSSFLKDDNLNYYGDGYSTTVMNKEGKKMDLKNLMWQYEDKAYEIEDSKNPDPIRQKELESGVEVLDALIKKGYLTVNKTIADVKKEVDETKNKAKYDSDNEEDWKFVENARESIINSLEDKALYQNNDYTMEQANLIASQMLLEKRKNEPKDEFDKLGKMESKSAEVINSKLGEKKEEKKEKSEGLFSKLGLKKKEKPEKPEEEGEKGEGKASMLLSKAGKFAENVAFGVAGKVLGANLPGASGMLAQKGLGSLKGAIDKNIGGKKNTPSEAKESKSSLAKQESPAGIPSTATPTLTNSVKKLSPQTKKEESKSSEQTEPSKATTQPAASKSTESATPAPKSKETSKSDTGNQSALGSPQDITDIKNALSRIASILEGPLTVSQLESPFRPDSRRV